MPYNPTHHHRRTIRLQGYDYSQSGMYFVTICVQNRECLFGEIVNGKMRLNEYGRIVNMVWNRLPQHYSNISLNAFVIMPNHIHGIIEMTTTTTTDKKQHKLSEIVRALKTFSARQINELRNMQGKKLWQRNYWEHIIRNDNAYQRIANYIINNPENWENDKLHIK